MRIESHEWPVLVVAGCSASCGRSRAGGSWLWRSWGRSENHLFSWVKALLLVPAVAGVFVGAWAGQYGITFDLLTAVSASAVVAGGLVGLSALALIRRLGT